METNENEGGAKPVEVETITTHITNPRKKAHKNKGQMRDVMKNLNAKSAKKGKKFQKNIRKADPFPGDAPIPSEKVKKYRRGHKMNPHLVRTKDEEYNFIQKEKKISDAIRQAARSELLLQEESGFLEADEGEETAYLRQHDIADATDITSASKYFELHLPQFGPYRMNYTRNGRHLLMGGKKGHVAALDWQSKKLLCELNVMETIHDVRWLHIETMFAVAQKEWTYIYDNQGIELHCLKTLESTLRLEFLPYHFLLVAANAKGYLSYLDVSIGQKVAGHQTSLGRLGVMCQNPSNAIIHLGHAGGTVSLWSPNVKEPLVKMLCHGGGTRSIAVNRTGQYMATSGVDRKVKIWDLRMYKMLQSYKVSAGAGHLDFSHKDMLAAGIGNIVEVYNDCCTKTTSKPYMCHRQRTSVTNLQFCPFEDVLGVGHGAGFSSLLIPGSGEANFDALEANPYQTKKQRRQAEVQMLLDKVQPDMITLDTAALGQVDKKSLLKKMEEKKNLLYVKKPVIDFEPKYKKKGRSKAGRVEKRKQGVKYESKRDIIKKTVTKTQKEAAVRNKEKQSAGKGNVLDRFKRDTT